MKPLPLSVVLMLFVASMALAADPPKRRDPNDKIRDDRPKVTQDERWVYNDLVKGTAEAKKTGKPMLVVFRCIPCVSCAGFDAALLVNATDRLKPLMDQFICVRIVQANAMDLAQFQFDYDLSFAAFFMNADGTVYGRYGTRSDQKDTERDLSMDSFAKAMEGSLELHKGFPANKTVLTAKRGPAPRVAQPEDYPMLTPYKAKQQDADELTHQSCVHCHQIRNAERADIRGKNELMTDEVMFPWPMPDVVGMSLDAKEKAKVTAVSKGSAAEKAGVKVGDEIATLAGQPIVSIADVQYVLHNTPSKGAAIKATVRRGTATQDVTLTLDPGWRRATDISWRASTWDFRLMGLGGMRSIDMTDAERTAAGLDTKQMALRLLHVVDRGKWMLAKNAGFRNGDVIVAFDGMTDRMTEAELLTYIMQKKKPGEKIAATVLREGKKLELGMALP